MDYTTVCRQLIYKDREDIDDFPVDETDNIEYITMESVFMEKLESRPFIKDSYNAAELILQIFNNARYITTLIYSENHPQLYLRKYLLIAESDGSAFMFNHVAPATMALVVNYLLHYLGEAFYGSRIVKAIINNFKDWDGLPTGRQDFYDLLIDRTSETDKYPRWTTDDEEFPFRDIKDVLNDDDIEPYDIVADMDYIVRETFGSYEGRSECPQILKSLKVLMNNYERSKELSEGIREKLDAAYQKLKKAYPHAGLKWEDDASATVHSEPDLNVQDLSLPSSWMENSKFDPDWELLQNQIEALKHEVNQLAHEKAVLEKKNSDLVASERNNRLKMEKVWAEKAQLEDKLHKNKSNTECITPEKAFTASGKECFTKAKMGLLIYTIASLTDGPTPIKKQLVPIISTIGGWEETSVNSEMKKAGFNQKDMDDVAKVFSAMPNFASEIKKQIPRKLKSKK